MNDASQQDLCSCNLGIFMFAGHKPLLLTWKILCSFHLLPGGVRVIWFGGETGGDLFWWIAKNPKHNITRIDSGAWKIFQVVAMDVVILKVRSVWIQGVHLALLLDNGLLNFYFLPCESSTKCVKVAISCCFYHSNQLQSFPVLVFRPVDPRSVIISCCQKHRKRCCQKSSVVAWSRGTQQT